MPDVSITDLEAVCRESCYDCLRAGTVERSGLLVQQAVKSGLTGEYQHPWEYTNSPDEHGHCSCLASALRRYMEGLVDA